MLKKLKEKIKQFNDYLADKLSYVLSAMVTFWIITALVIIPLLVAHPTSLVAWASYLCSVIFQGIALPVLGYTAKKAGDKTDIAIAEILATSNKVESLVELIEKQQEHISQDVDKTEALVAQILDMTTKMEVLAESIKTQQDHINSDVDTSEDIMKQVLELSNKMETLTEHINSDVDHINSDVDTSEDLTKKLVDQQNQFNDMLNKILEEQNNINNKLDAKS